MDVMGSITAKLGAATVGVLALTVAGCRAPFDVRIERTYCS